MPFMKGIAPVRRTIEYLNGGKLVFVPQIRVMTINYNINQKASDGAYDFQFWHFPQIRYKNKHMQLLRFKNMTPTPFIQLLFIGGEKQLIDIHGRTRTEIHDHLQDTFCVAENIVEHKVNPANFGYGCKRWCICEVPGQVPCPAFIQLPDSQRGKFTRNENAQDS